MALPLPIVIPDAQPGGSAFNAFNHIQQAMNAMKAGEIENQYAPLKLQADASSKMAYSNLMGPQFLAKLMSNPDILANLSDPQKRQALNMLYTAGGGRVNENTLMRQQVQNRNIFSNQDNLSPQDINSIANMQPGQSYTVQGKNPLNSPQYSQNENYSNNQMNNMNPSFAENVGSYEGIKSEGKEAGKLRAQDIKDLGDLIFSGQGKQTTLDQISDIIKSPEFEKMRQMPILGRHELSYYQRYGSPEQQNMAGQLVTLSGNIIRDASQDFKGAFRKGEQDLLQNMKINPGDTVDAAKGKLEQLSYLNKLITQRAQTTADIMNQQHVSKTEAEKQADKLINGDEIRKGIHTKLNPTVTIRNKKTGETKTISIEEARKLGVSNV
jgi:hypothetical protein